MTEVSGTKGAASDRAVARVLETRAVASVVSATVGAAAQQTAGADVARLSGVAADIAAAPPVDSDRIQQIKRAIDNGTFPILPATVADRLLAVRYQWLGHDQA